MPIRYVPNDPSVAGLVLPRLQDPRPEPTPDRAGFTYQGAVPADTYEVGTPGFLFWQCREAALASVATAADLGLTPASWARARPRRTLRLLPDAGVDLNAYYDGDGLNFFHYAHPDGTVTSAGASVDVVAHETGHALLDVLRPDLWSLNTVEAASFHEAFADGMALLTALADRETRLYLLSRLDEPNAVEAVAEDLAAGVGKALGPSHPAAEPRHALNTFAWQAPSRLPASAPAAGLAREFHSYSRIFTGVLYDLVRRLFRSGPGCDESALEAAAQTAGRLLIAGAAAAVPAPRFFAAVGGAMIQADQVFSGGAHRPALREALEAHGLAPAPLRVIPEILSGPPAFRRRAVALDDLDPRLAGCVALATEPARSGVLPEMAGGDEEVKSFVATLLAHDRIDFQGPDHRRFEATPATPLAACPTHVLRAKKDGRSVLTRIRFV